MRLCLLISLVALLIVTATGQWSPRDVYRIDCGAISNSSVDGTEWQPDAMASGGQIAGNLSSNSSNAVAAAAPYPTARVFTNTQSYNFPVSPGRHWIRLHFMPLAFQGLDPANARFSVSVGSHLLLLNASIADEIRRQQQDFLVREFSIYASGSTLSIAFDPSTPGSFAFVNGIEVVSMAHDALAPTVSKMGQLQQQQEELDLVSSVTQTMYRLNVGGPLVAASNDSARQGRTWVPDDPYITGVVKGEPATPAVADISYPSGVPEYIAPRGVYGTARTLGRSSNTASNSVNISWLFGVEPGYSYYVRLHFAEIVYSSPLQRIFNVYIDNRTATRLDLIQLVPANTPYFKDYTVDAGVGTSIRLQIGPTPGSGSEFQDAILNGLEIFKLNDSAGNLGGTPATTQWRAAASLTVTGILRRRHNAANRLSYASLLPGRGFQESRRRSSLSTPAPRNRPLLVHATASPLEIDAPNAPPAERSSSSSSSVSRRAGWLDAFHRFSRPHTVIGTALGVVSVSLLAIRGPEDCSVEFLVGLVQALVPALLMNIYIVGLNQIYDIDIDKVNKPYLPLASGEYSLATGISIVLVSALLSLGFGAMVNSKPLLAALGISLLLGTAYSVELPFLRWKRSALVAASCILSVRAVVVQLGFYLHIQSFVLRRGWSLPWSLLFATGFMCFFSVVIALFKDIPDVEGDRTYGIHSFSVRMGQKKVFDLCLGLLQVAYVVAVLVCGALARGLWSKTVAIVGHATLAAVLWLRSRNVDLSSKAAIASFYMFVWKLFYAEYLLLPFIR